MLSLPELPGDVLTIILLHLDVLALRALSHTCSRLRRTVNECRIAWLQCLVDQHRAPPDRDLVVDRFMGDSADPLRRRATRPHRALHTLASGSSERVTATRYAMTGAVGRVVAFYQVDEQHVLVGENCVDTSSLTVYRLGSQSSTIPPSTIRSTTICGLNVEAQLTFDTGATCMDLQPARDGISLELIVDVQRFGDHERYMSHELYQLRPWSNDHEESGWEFVLLASWRGTHEPHYTCIARDWIAWNFSTQSRGEELLFWNWRRQYEAEGSSAHRQVQTQQQLPGLFIRATVTDLDREFSPAWAVHFTYPYVQVIDTHSGAVQLYSLASPNRPPPLDESSSSKEAIASPENSPSDQQPSLLQLEAFRSSTLPSHWKRDITLWQHGQAARIPPTNFGPDFGVVEQVWLHAGVTSTNELAHCILPVYGSSASTSSSTPDSPWLSPSSTSGLPWPLVLTIPLPEQIRRTQTRPPRVIHACTFADRLATFIVSTSTRALWVCIQAWEDVLATGPVKDIVVWDDRLAREWAEDESELTDEEEARPDRPTSPVPAAVAPQTSPISPSRTALDDSAKSHLPPRRRICKFHRVPVPVGTPRIFLDDDLVNWMGPWPADVDTMTGTLMYLLDPFRNGMQDEAQGELVALRFA